MTKAKRGRGRPKGSGIDDSAIMLGIAEILADRPETKPTAAIKLLDTAWDASSNRRRQRKWKAVGAPLLQRAKASRIAKTKEVAAQRAAVLASNRDNTMRAMQANLASAALLLKTEAVFPNLALARQMREMHASGFLETAREAHKSALAFRAAFPDLGRFSRQMVEQQKALASAMPNVTRRLAEHDRAMREALGMTRF